MVAARREGRERHQTLFVTVSPGQRDERRHGQTHFVLGAELGRDGMAAGLCFRSRHDDTRQRRGDCPDGEGLIAVAVTVVMDGSQHS